MLIKKDYEVRQVIQQIDTAHSNDMVIVLKDKEGKAIEPHHNMAVSECGIFRFTKLYYLRCYVRCEKIRKGCESIIINIPIPHIKIPPLS